MAQAPGRTAINDCLQHIDHLVGTLLANNLVHARLELGNGVTLAVLDAGYEHVGGTDAVIDECRIGTDHFADSDFARSQTQCH